MRTNKKRILLTGVSGLLGGNLAIILRDEYEISGIYNNNKVEIDNINSFKLNLTDFDKLRKLYEKVSPDIVIHTAAITNVEDCEKYHDWAYLNNVTVTDNLIKLVKEKDIDFVFISTDAFFENETGKYADEKSEPKPINFYGETKYLCEKNIINNLKNYILVRTNFYGWNIQNKYSLAEWIYHSLKKELQINLFKDVYFSPIFVNNLVDIINFFLHNKQKGIFNIAGSESISKCDYGYLIADIFGLNEKLINPISVNNFTFCAPRSKNMALNTNKLLKIYPEAKIDLAANVIAFKNCLNDGYYKILKRS